MGDRDKNRHVYCREKRTCIIRVCLFVAGSMRGNMLNGMEYLR